MGKLIVSTQMTLDGVMDPIDWFDRRDEHAWDGAAGTAALDQLRAADALLLGRMTYEGLAGAWPAMTDDVGFAERMNALPKHVVSRSSPGPLMWNATLVEGEPAASVAALKARTGGNLLSYGCGQLARHLIEQRLVDELRFWVNPVSWGAGKRPFDDGGPVWLELAGTTTFDTGVVLLSYRPAAHTA